MIVLFQWRPGDRTNIHFQIQNHPFHTTNNINGIHADSNRNGIGEEIQRLSNKPGLPYQDSYVRLVLDLLNGYDNVIYEITNEGDRASYDWQEHMVHLIHSYESSKPNQHAVMMNMGYTVEYSMRMDLANMTPRPDLTSTGYALVNPGAEYLVYSGSSSFNVNLAGSGSTYAVEWLNPANGVYSSGGTVVGGGTVTFNAPFGGEAVLYLKTGNPLPTRLLLAGG